MTETTTPQTETPAAPAAKPKAYRVNLLSKSSAQRLKCEAHPKRNGAKAYVEVETRDKKGKVTKRERGMSTTFADMDAARQHVDALAAQARKDGWLAIERKGGFASKADTFSSLPKPK